MRHFDELKIVHYCHPDCEPFLNVCRLPEAEAYAKAREMAERHPDTTAFGRFADFTNYYPLRMKQDALLYQAFVDLGGKPKETHPLSFTLGDSAYLHRWFGEGKIYRFALNAIPDDAVSFTLGDSGATLKRTGTVKLHTKAMLLQKMYEHPGGVEGFLREAEERWTYVEVQLWDDGYVRGRDG